jgi:uncharacterized membrane protein YeiB
VPLVVAVVSSVLGGYHSQKQGAIMDWETVFSLDWKTVFSGISVFLASAALVISALSYRHAEHAAQAQTVAKFLEEYATREMADALTQMALLKSTEWEEVLMVDRRVPDKVTTEAMCKFLLTTKDVKHARRRVLHFFKKAYQLYEIGYLSKKSMSIITDLSGYRLLFDVV